MYIVSSFYLEGASEYTTCTSLLTTSSGIWPQTALFQIASNGIPLSKLVIGKPATASDGSNGYMSTSMLASCLEQAKNNGWGRSSTYCVDIFYVSDERFSVTKTEALWSGR